MITKKTKIIHLLSFLLTASIVILAFCSESLMIHSNAKLLAKSFQPRLTAPTSSDKAWKWYKEYDYSNNCARYAYARICEILDTDMRPLYGPGTPNSKFIPPNALSSEFEDWLKSCGYESETVPRPGSVYVVSGHVAIVELVDEKRHIITVSEGNSFSDMSKNNGVITFLTDGKDEIGESTLTHDPKRPGNGTWFDVRAINYVERKGTYYYLLPEDSEPPIITNPKPEEKDEKGFYCSISASDALSNVASVFFSVEHESGTKTFPAKEYIATNISGNKWRTNNKILINDFGNQSGLYLITAKATDANGFVATESFKISVGSPNGTKYNILYYQEEGSLKQSSTKTAVSFNHKTSTAKIEDLTDINKAGYVFKGWHVYRDYDDTWYMKNKSTGEKYWLPMKDGKEPDGFVRGVYKSGTEVSRTAPYGNVYFYGTWTPKTITVQYDNGKIISTQKQKPVYGDGTKVLTADALGSDFKKTGYTLNGWRVRKDGKWLVRNTSTKKLYWRNSAGSGYTYYKLGLTSGLNTVFKCSENNNTITLVAAWKANRFKIQYYANPNGNSLSGAKYITGSDQSCVYGSKNKTQTYKNLGITVPTGYSEFKGWVVVNSAGKRRYKSILGDNALWLDPDTEMIPIGYKIWLYKNGCSVTKTVSSGTVKFYAQFTPNSYSLDYYNNGKKADSSKDLNYGKKYNAKTLAQIAKITTPKGYTFRGWKLQRPDGSYLMKRVSDGKKVWKKLSNNAVPSGYKIYYHNDGFRFSSLTPENGKTVKAIASWTPIKYTIEYGKRNGGGPDTASQKTTVTYNVKHSTRSFKKLGFTSPNNDTKNYEGRWRIYRSDTKKWLCYDTKDQKKVWITEDTYKYNNEQINNHKRYVYYYYKEKQEVSRTVSTPCTVRFEVFWRLKTGKGDSWETYDKNLKKWRN
ncbi:MAG: hypothetical protein K6G90_07150 [Clostridia bacterium]|nr:hypothetical protein [Clostridia bacterium]